MSVLCMNVRKFFPGFDLELKFNMENELLVLFGFSGAGKTVTLKMIAGLVCPDTGRIEHNGIVFYDRDKHTGIHPQDRKVGYVFQDHNLFPHMSVFQNILYGAAGGGDDDPSAAAEVMLVRFSLEELRDKYPAQISGGQKQRVAFARALARRPDLLLLDEPFSALDNPVRVAMRELVCGIRREFDTPVIFVTHDLGEAVQLADRMLIMDRGQILQSGTPGEIVSNPANGTVASLVDVDNCVPERLRALQKG